MAAQMHYAEVSFIDMCICCTIFYKYVHLLYCKFGCTIIL
jgi:hypothetical protein